MSRQQIRIYAKYLKTEKRYSPHTVIAYISDLKQLHQSVKIDLLMLSREEIKQYLASLKQKQLSTNSINRKLESIKAFYRYCYKKRLINDPVCASLAQSKPGKVDVGYLSQQKFMSILEGLGDLDLTNRRKLRDFLIIEILYHTGCRASELINLRKGDIYFASLKLKVLGKGRVERYLPISNQISELLRMHLKNWRIKTTRQFVFVNDRYKRIYPMFLRRLLEKSFPADLVGRSVSPHVIRHSVATHLYQNGASMKNVKDFLGHKSYRSTDTYLHFDKETLRTIYDRCHPKGNKTKVHTVKR